MRTKQSILEDIIQRVVIDFPRLGMYHLSKNMDVGSFRLEPGYHLKIVSDHYLREPTYEVLGVRETLFEMDYHEKISLGDAEALLDAPRKTLAGRLFSGGFFDLKDSRTAKA